MPTTEEILSEVRSLHEEVDAAASALAARHVGRLRCQRGCAGCCVDDLSVFEVEAAQIRHHHATLLREGKPGPAGACAFLDGEGTCRVYEHRPYVCRTQGLPLRWIDYDAGTELRDICELNLPGPALEELDEAACWLLGPYEGRLAMLQARSDGGALRRIALRELFE